MCYGIWGMAIFRMYCIPLFILCSTLFRRILTYIDWIDASVLVLMLINEIYYSCTRLTYSSCIETTNVGSMQVPMLAIAMSVTILFDGSRLMYFILTVQLNNNNNQDEEGEPLCGIEPAQGRVDWP